MVEKKVLGIERVIYGKESTPEQDREYKLMGLSSSPVGNVSDWKTKARNMGKDSLFVFEKDNSLKVIDLKTNKITTKKPYFKKHKNYF